MSAQTTSPDWDPQAYAKHASFVPAKGAPLLEWLAPKPGMRVLDLGCGDGVLTQSLVDAGCDVLGVDSSPAFVQAARARGLRARREDGQTLPFNNEFDAVFSNAALHWMRERPDDVIAGVNRALRRGGLFVAEMGGQGNVGAVRPALHAALQRRGLPIDDPWFFPSLEDYRARLEHGGFSVERIELFPRPTLLSGDARGWVITFARPFLQRVEPGRTGEIIDEVSAALNECWRQADGSYVADYVRLRFRARKAGAA